MDVFTVIRRVETISQTGRVVNNPTAFVATGVVTATSPNDLQRVPEMQYMNKSISIYTQWKLQGPSPGMQPDVIVWHGTQFLVRALDDYSGYGRGFIMVICVSVDAMEPAPYMPDPVGSA